MRTYHQLLALKVLFTEEQVISFEIHSHCATTDEQLARIGIAELNKEEKCALFTTFLYSIVLRIEQGNKGFPARTGLIFQVSDA